MLKVKSDGRIEVPVSVLDAARRDFLAERISDEQTLECIRKTFTEYNYVADPHTAVGIAAAMVVTDDRWSRVSTSYECPSEVVQVVLSTAHPAKFSGAVTRALNGLPSFNFESDILPNEFKDLLNMKRRVIDVDNRVEAVKEVIDSIEPHDGVKVIEVGV